MAITLTTGRLGAGMSRSAEELEAMGVSVRRQLVALGPEDWPHVQGPYCVLPREAYDDWEEAQRVWSAEMAAWGYELRKIERALLEAKAADRSRRVAASGLPLSATGAPVGDVPSKRALSIPRRSTTNPRSYQVQLDLFEGASAPLGNTIRNRLSAASGDAVRGVRG